MKNGEKFDQNHRNREEEEKEEGEDKVVVVDGSNIKELVENDDVFTRFVDHKFDELDKDRDGHLSVGELQPAVADIGAALGLPAAGASPDSDHIYSEVLSEFTYGKQERVSKTEFKEVLSDILLGMAAGLKRDPVVILRIDGEDLSEFLISPGFEPEMISVFSEIQSVYQQLSLKNSIVKALEKLTVEQGMPPASDPWVMSSIVEPALAAYAVQDFDKPASQEMFLAEFKKTAENLARRLKESPVIVAHSENTFDGSGIKRLLSNKFELDKALNLAIEALPKDRDGKLSKGQLRIALDVLAPSAALPPIGAVEEMDKIVGDAFKMVSAEDGKAVKDDEFRKILTEILGSVMLQLEGNPVSVSSNSVVHDPHSSSSTLLQSPS